MAEITEARTRMEKKIICVDFDGVIHSYTSPWTDAVAVADPPTLGAFDWLRAAVQRFHVCIYSSRSKQEGGRDAMRTWMERHGLDADTLAALTFSAEKPAAFMTLDDRAICFDGTWPDLDLLERFRPWNKREYPKGRMSADDAGALAMKLSSAQGVVRIDFGKPVTWLGLGPNDARALAQLLLRHADQVEGVS